jgi:tRNA 2-thiouridine synthesizing protein B
MAALHLVNKARALEACLRVAGSEDSILLLEDGVYAAAKGLAADRLLYALEIDVVARGLLTHLTGDIRLISDEAFVTLVERHQPIVTWRS